MIIIEGIYLHAFGLVYGEAGGAEFSTTDVTRDGSRAPFRRSRRPDSRLLGSTVPRTILGTGRFHVARLGFLRPVLVSVATEIQSHWLLNGFGHRHTLRRLRRRRDVLDLGVTALWMAVESFWLIRPSASLAGFRRALRRSGREDLQIVGYACSRIFLLHRGQHFRGAVSNHVIT